MEKSLKFEIDPYNEEIWDEDSMTKFEYFIEIDNESYPIKLNSDISYGIIYDRFYMYGHYVLPDVNINFIGDDAYENSRILISKLINECHKKLNTLKINRFNNKGNALEVIILYGVFIKGITQDTYFTLNIDHFEKIIT